MSTIPSTFNNTIPSYTVVGGTRRAASTGLSAVLLNRGGRYPRLTLFQELEKVGFDYIISVEGKRERYDVEDLSARFPFVRFILLKEDAGLGEQINLAVSEVSTPLFFVLWNDLRLLHSGGAARMADRLLCSADELKSGNPGPYKRLCTTPMIQNSHFETLSTLIVPAIRKGKFLSWKTSKNRVESLLFASGREGTATLFPFDGVGIYDRDRFIRLGGFDSAMKNSYWQFMDFGLRAHLWGESIKCTQFVRLSYNGEAPAMDTTVEESYCRFYLKNLAPVFRGDHAELPRRRFLFYLLRSGVDPFQAWSDFAQGKEWVHANRSRFREDARSLIKGWENPEQEAVPTGNGGFGSSNTAGNNGAASLPGGENDGYALFKAGAPSSGSRAAVYGGT